jgi:hypothetical protein
MKTLQHCSRFTDDLMVMIRWLCPCKYCKHIDHMAPPSNPQELALTSPTSGGRLVGIVRSRTLATEFSFSFIMESPWEFDSQLSPCCVDCHKWGVDEDLVVVVRFKVLFQNLTGEPGGNVRETSIRIVGNLAKIQVAFLPNITLGYYPTLTCSVSICGNKACKCYHYMPISCTSCRHLTEY